MADFTLMSGRGWCLRKGMCGGWIDGGNGDGAGCLWFCFGNSSTLRYTVHPWTDFFLKIGT